MKAKIQKHNCPQVCVYSIYWGWQKCVMLCRLEKHCLWPLLLGDLNPKGCVHICHDKVSFTEWVLS